MASKQNYTNTIVDEILFHLSEVTQLLPRPLESPYAWVKRQRGVSRKSYLNSIARLRQRGLVEVLNKNQEKFLRLTQKGQLATLLAKAKLPRPQSWDGKWRLFMFDIPERARQKRNQLRQLLKDNNFFKLQASVFISPFVLNRDCVIYLKQEGLMDYIRIVRVDELDDDKFLKRHFKLA